MNEHDAINEAWLYIAPDKRPEQLHPIALAYIGDTVYDLFVRQYLLSKTNHRPDHLHKQASALVSAKAQAKHLERIMPLLTDEEADVVRKGRNAKSNTTAKNANVLEYRHSTAFECLVGYLYYKRRLARLNELIEFTFA